MIQYDKSTGDYVIKGFEAGIADDPYAGISDIRNINLISIPKEGSVNFATALNSPILVSIGTVISANAGADTVTYTGAIGLVTGSAVVFSGGSLPSGISAGTIYWVAFSVVGTFQLYTDYEQNSLVDIGGTGTGTFTVFGTTNAPKYFTFDTNGLSYWMIDSGGLVWTNQANLGWRYTGNTTHGVGNGLVYYRASDSTGYIFAFGNGQIDYQKLSSSGGLTGAWVYGWKPSDATTGNTNYLKRITSGTIHDSIVAPDNKVYYCDGNWIGRFFQSDPLVIFDPSNTASYTFDTTAVLPFTDTAQCLAPLANNLLIGGAKNVIYPWDTVGQLATYPILVAEYNIQKIVTVNTNAYALVGNRGRIYYTNGSQAVLFKKMPDHISGTVEPYYTWGGLMSTKNQIYFSASVTSNAGVAINQYGGVWAIDVDTKAIRLTNKLSYGTYAGYATALIPNFSATPAGTGFYAGWDSGASTYGIDITSSTPYIAGEATIDSDLIPIGTVLKPTTNGRVEFKLAVPIVNGETVKLQYRQAFSANFTDISSTTLFNFAGIATKDWNGYAGVYQNVNFENSQWIQIRAVLTSTVTSPSYCRLTEIRLGN